MNKRSGAEARRRYVMCADVPPAGEQLRGREAHDAFGARRHARGSEARGRILNEMFTT